MRVFERTTLVLCVAMSFALLACGGDDDDAGGGGNGSKPAKPGGQFGNPDVNTSNSAAGKGGSGATAGANAGCGTGLARTSRVTPRVILVLDGSCSMSTDYPANGAQSATECTNNPNGRWAALRNALVGPGTGVVTQLQDVVEFGLAIFGTDRECPIPGQPIDSSLNNLAAIEGALPQVQPGRFTPTGPALDWVYENMFSGGQLDTDQGPQILILATDGEPNSCDNGNTNYQPSVDALHKGQNLGVRTYVISLADASGQFHDHLQQLADIGAAVDQSGGGATLYEPTTPDALRDNLQALIGGAVGCDVSLNGLVDDTKKCEGTVTLNGQPLKCNDPDGYVVPDGRHIRIQGKACDTLKNSPNAQLDADFPCGVFRVD